jgi:hypothetical protein
MLQYAQRHLSQARFLSVQQKNIIKERWVAKEAKKRDKETTRCTTTRVYETEN